MVMMDFLEETKKNKKRPNEEVDHYVLALEEEISKIQVFHRELPLCLDLVNLAIEKCKQRQEQEQDSSQVAILEEFIPLKETTTNSQKEQGKSNNLSSERIDKKFDWLQLWNEDTNLEKNEAVPHIHKDGGAFIPFKPIKASSTITSPPPVVPSASTSSTAAHNATNNNHIQAIGGEKESRNNSRKTRRCWSPELHRRFLQALQQLGGSRAATPKQIRELMKVDGLTNDEVKSHLQKYRLHTRRPASTTTTHGSDNSPQAPFVVMGGIWVPPSQDCGAGSIKGDVTTAPERVYTLLAAPGRQQQLQLSTDSFHSGQKSSRGEHSVSVGDRRSDTRTATSASTGTTTSSPNI